MPTVKVPDLALLGHVHTNDQVGIEQIAKVMVQALLERP